MKRWRNGLAVASVIWWHDRPLWAFPRMRSDARGAIVLREKVARGRIALRLANLPPCLIGIEAGLATTMLLVSLPRLVTM